MAADTVNENGQNVPLLIAAANVTVTDLALTLGPLDADLGQRDLGVFVTPGGGGATLSGLTVTRDGSRTGFEPAMGPGSRGVLVFVADGVVIDGCTVEGPFEDGIHLPSVNTQVRRAPNAPDAPACMRPHYQRLPPTPCMCPHQSMFSACALMLAVHVHRRQGQS